MLPAEVDLKIHARTNGLLPEEVRRIYIRFLQDYFKSTTSEYVWDPDPVKTKVLIASPDLHIEDTDARPLVIVSFNGGGWMGVYKDQYVQDIYEKNPDGTWITNPEGKRVPGRLFSDTFKGGMTCICRDREIRSTSLGSKVFMALTVFKEAMRNIGMFDISLPRISREIVVKADVKEILTEVRVDTEYMHNVVWSLTPTDYQKYHATVFTDEITFMVKDC